MTERVLDRRPFWSPQHENYPMRASVATAALPLRSYSWRHAQFDQGNQGACTVFSAMTEAAARPRPYYGDPVRKPFDIEPLNTWAKTTGYQRVRELDEWEGEDYEGSSVNAACKLGRELGWWDEWRWALGAADARAHAVCYTIGYEGPVMVGGWWRGDMWAADEDGFLRYSGAYEGGHAFLFTRYSVKRNAVWTPNSWGGDGQGWLSVPDLIQFLDEEGEAAIAVGRQVL